jgi:hypothetical protein
MRGRSAPVSPRHDGWSVGKRRDQHCNFRLQLLTVWRRETMLRSNLATVQKVARSGLCDKLSWSAHPDNCQVHGNESVSGLCISA